MMDSATNLIRALDRLTLQEKEALPAEELRRFRALLFHWQQLTNLRLEQEGEGIRNYRRTDSPGLG